ncbi:MAG TPA: urease accessory protein UreD [Vicinamibacterales bacterium]
MADGRAELRFAGRGGRTVLTHSRVRAPITLVRPFPLEDGGQLVQLITLGPGLCGGDLIELRIIVESGARVVITTPAASRILSMDAERQAEQSVHLTVEAGGTLEYYPAVTIPFPESAFKQTIHVDAASGSRVGVLETWALGRTSRGEYLRFRHLSSRTVLHVESENLYADATELCPSRDRAEGAAVLAGRRYLASGFWFGATLDEEPASPLIGTDLLFALGQSRPRIAYLRALGDDAPALDAALRVATDRIAAAWHVKPVTLDRFRC